MSGSYLRPVNGEIPVTAGKPKRVVFVDESPLYAESWRAVLACRYGPAVSFESYRDPIAALDALGPDVSLLLVDLDLPLFGGRKLFELAKERGVACRRIVILSSRPAEELHRLFPDGSCLAVINKTEPNQQNAFLMILDSIVKRH
jgi:DNA-binding NarL/FixJ family response regulator